ncbi:histidine ammonia-lyase [Candidatus Daviesbacteria bacterium]|nr:histidine ammonia-lyase [Candidatus Daviesbacteria bacterium]
MNISNRQLSYREIYESIKREEKISVNPKILKRLGKQREKIKKILNQKGAVYGINTGFGALKTKSINPEDILTLQENLIRSHAAGVGNPFPQNIVKAVMILIINNLSKGYSGVRPVIIETLIQMVNKGVIPVVPEKGSVGSSGDLNPSAHIVLVAMGEGEAYFNGVRISGYEAMKQAGIPSVKIEAKEGLALINNTATMTANAIFALSDACYLADIADFSGALCAEALRATHAAFDSRVHRIKPSKGQLLVAQRLRKLLLGSAMQDKTRIQDQYSIRCMPQIHGAVRDAMEYVRHVVNIEVNSVTDNPLIFSKGQEIEIISCGNFHGEAMSLAMDTLRIAVCELANIADRRICSILDSNHSYGLPAFLAKNPGLNSGLMILQYTTAALVSENKILAHPAVVDSIPTSANIEDIVSMGTISARKTLEVVENVKYVLAVELLSACQAVDFRLKEGYNLAQGTLKVYNKIRKIVPFFDNDQEYTPFINKIVNLIDNRGL